VREAFHRTRAGGRAHMAFRSGDLRMLMASSEPANVDQRNGAYAAAFLLATSLFFMWAIAHNLNES
jgi:hypothetical protein